MGCCRCLLGWLPDKLLEAVFAAGVTTSGHGGSFLAWHLLQADITCCYDWGLVRGPADISMWHFIPVSVREYEG